MPQSPRLQAADLRHTPNPAALVLAFRRRELIVLRATLAAREDDLAQLRRQLHSFEARYIRQVGVLYVQLDDWQFRLDELLASRKPAPPPATGYWANQPVQASGPTPEPEQKPDLRALFREVAKRIHPDRATGALDELRRTALMAQANDALQRLDADLLHRMLHGYDPAGNPAREDPAVELARVIALIVQTQADLVSLDAEYNTLTHSEMAQLRDTTVAAALQGRDHLAEMAARVKGSIGNVMGRYERESSPNRRPAPIDPMSLLSAEIIGVKI